MPKQIPLSNGLSTSVDDEDYLYLSQFKWLYTNGYASTYVKPNGQWKRIYLHRLLVDVEPNQVVDHIDRDTLNNTRANLRPATLSQNRGNQAAHRSGTVSGCAGVTWRKDRNLWQVRVQKDGHRYHFGYFDDLETAILMRDAAVKTLQGAFALLARPTVAIPGEIQVLVEEAIARYFEGRDSSD